MFDAISAFFKNSESIFIARMKLLLGGVFTALQTSGVDVSSLVTESPKWQNAIKVLFAWLIFDGTLTEWARRRNDPNLGKTDDQGK